MIGLQAKPKDWPGSSSEWIEYQTMLRREEEKKRQEAEEAKREEARRTANLPENKIVRAIEALAAAIRENRPEVKDDEAIVRQITPMVRTLDTRLGEMTAALKVEERPKPAPDYEFHIDRDNNGRILTVRAKRVER